MHASTLALGEIPPVDVDSTAICCSACLNSPLPLHTHLSRLHMSQIFGEVPQKAQPPAAAPASLAAPVQTGPAQNGRGVQTCRASWQRQHMRRRPVQPSRAPRTFLLQLSCPCRQALPGRMPLPVSCDPVICSLDNLPDNQDSKTYAYSDGHALVPEQKRKGN
eukprot:1140511-Pelagomonas_calceolata.AAC.5